MSTTTETGQERVRAVIREHIGTEFWTQHSLANALAAAGLLRGDDDLPAGLRERVVAFLRTVPINWYAPQRVTEERDDLLRALTGAGASPVTDNCRPCGGMFGQHYGWCPNKHGVTEAPATPTRRMRGSRRYPAQSFHGREHDEIDECALGVPCQPVAEPAPMELESSMVAALKREMSTEPAPCRHPGAVAVETVVDHSILTSTGRVVERVTALYCPGCGARIAVPQEVSHG